MNADLRLLIVKFTILKSIFLLCLTTTLAEARDWKRIDIPGAVCGNGRPYSIFLDKKDDKKLYVEFMGGGACWSTWTCYGPRLRAWLHRMPKLPHLSLMSSDDPVTSPTAGESALYFPYCTGDVYAGEHVADYQLGATVHHVGSSNIQKALNYLEKTKLLDFKKFRELTIYGASAGAIGGFLHARRVAKKMPNATQKSLIADSPGLHFGEDFWEKFTDEMRADIQRSLEAIEFKYNPNDGMVAPGVPSACAFYSDFSIGILQASQDLVMSRLFGEITHQEHEDLVYSPEGVFQQTLPVPNCAVWAPSSKWHTYLLLSHTAEHRAAHQGLEKTALEFSQDILDGKTQVNYR